MRGRVSIGMLTAAGALAGCLAGCEEGATVNPVLGASSGEDAGTDAAPPVDAGPFKRTVMTRNPFGGPAGNLFVDGDFELSTVPYTGAQVGWRAFTSSGSTALPIATETGGLCRSGLRCAIFEPKMAMYVRGAAANGKGSLVSMWGKVPPDSKCNVVSAVLVACDTGVVTKKLGTDPGPRADGWCNYNTKLTEQDSGQCLYITSSLKTDTTALLDALVMGPDDGTVSVKSAEIWVPDAETVEGAKNAAEYLRRTAPLGKKRVWGDERR